ncbi:DUF2948 family protein [Siculibacillus lacustris]|uniref:DUF2948 family protein n=1 Tax=Siculibacillus lacustris TaxID=1549641 RepID=A0A4Q9VS45_9HYPH|nr:DUF2948 family protein [Siculibacillus lacustris]TBW38791.1 DUF2948 family protein [Siculibacillus lacustris]
MSDLKLLALDAEDLDILSAHLQDAVMKVGDVHWLAGERRLVLTLNRFVWETADGRRSRSFERRRAALSFARVTRVQSHRLNRDAADTVLELLAVRFTVGDAPSGVVEMIFAGGGELRVEVECLEAALGDLGTAWATGRCPAHEV